MSKKYITDVIKIDGQLLDGNGSAGTSGQVLSSTGTATDWVSLSEISGVDGSGTANYIAKWSDADTIGNSIIYDNGTNVYVGGTSTTNSQGWGRQIASINSGTNGAALTLKDGNGEWQLATYYDNFYLTKGATTTMLIDSNGNVGIGTTTPGTKLEVDGVVKSKSYSIPSTSGTAQWVKLGRLTSGQGGRTFKLTAYIHQGYNALNNQDFCVEIFFKTSNGNSVNSDGFAGNSWYYSIGNNAANITPKWVGNAAGVSATYYDLYLNLPIHTLYSHYTVSYTNISSLDWEDSHTLGQTDPGTGSSTVLVADPKFNILNTNVGIGTTSPSQKLHVVGNVRIDDGYTLSWGNDTAKIAGNSSTNTLSLKTASTDRLYINSSGNVGIGTTSPNHKLDIYSNENVPLRIHRPSNANLDSSGAWGIGFSTRGDANTSTTDTRAGIFSYYNGNLFLATNNTSIVSDPDAYARLTILSAGNVGIGTPSPSKKLEVVSNTTYDGIQISGSSIPTLGIIDTTNNAKFVAYVRDSDATIGMETNHPLTINTNNTERMRITAGGDVGIGTTSPGAKLDISDSIPILRITGTRNASWTIGQTMASLEYFSEDASGSAANSVRASINLVNETSVYGSTTGLSFSTKGDVAGLPTERMRIDSSGNIGIGTASPGYKLQVIGDASVSTWLYVNNIYPTSSTNDLLLNTGAGRTITLNPTSTGKTVIPNGNVGIGTTIPDGILSIKSDTPILYIDDNGDNYADEDTQGSLLFRGRYFNGSSDLSYSQARIKLVKANADGTAGSNLVFDVLNDAGGGSVLTERMRIDENGNVGIGTTSPDSKLDVTGGNITINTLGTTFAYFKYGAVGSETSRGSITTDGIDLKINATADLLLLPTGAVGIGTTSPGAKLEVSQTTTGIGAVVGNTTHNSQLQIYTAAAYKNSEIWFGDAADADVGKIDYDHNINELLFTVNAAERMRIDSAGNVGIGTTDPASRLHTVVDLSVSTTDYASGSAGSRLLLKPFASTGNTYSLIQAQDVGGVSNNALALQPYGDNVGIGTTSPQTKLQVVYTDTHTSGDLTLSNSAFDIYNNYTTDVAGKGSTLTFSDNYQGINKTTRAAIKGGTEDAGNTANGFLAFYTDSGGANSMQERMYINEVGAIKFNNYNSTNRIGTPTYLLGTDASGNIVKTNTVPGSAAGPYLPLAGGTMTGTSGVIFPDNFKLNLGTSSDLQIYHDGSNSYVHDSGTGELRLNSDNAVRIRKHDNETMALFTANGAAELWYDNAKKIETTSSGVYVTGTATATTFSGDLNGTINTATTAVTKPNATNDTTVATTAFVQNLIGTIPAGLVFQGTWNAATNTPTLASGTGTTGNFYIVSVDGSTNLDGITDWKVGDWAVFVEQGASDQWEKVDNSSVLDGSGTGQTVALWSGSGTSNTLTDSIMTQAGGRVTTAGSTTATGEVRGGSFYDGYITWTAAQINRYGAAVELQFAPTNSSTFVKIGAGGSNPTIFNAYTGDATFAGTVTAPNLTIGSGNKIQFANNDYIRYDDAANRFHFDADGGTSNASVQAATFVGALSTTGISGNNFDITGVNQLKINDPGEGIVWQAGSSGDITLAVVDDTSDNILRLSGTNAELQVGTNRVLTTADEGSGNGLDADTLDGQHGSYYLAWGNLTGVPSTFTPSAHTLDSHSNVTITSNSSGEILKWNGAAWVNNTLAEAGIAAASHTHDDRYYTETETNNFFSGATAITGYNKTNWDAAYTYSQVGHLPLTGGTLSGDLTVNGGDIILGGTGRIQGIDTVSVNTDAANKLYVDNAVAAVPGTVTSVATTSPILGGTITSTGTISLLTPQNGDWWNGGAVVVGTDGVAEVGKYFDMHATDTATSDFDVRLTASTGSLAISGDLVVSGGDITLSGTGRIQGIDTVSASTDAVNKNYVDNAVSGFIDGSGAINQVAYWDDANTISGESNFYWDKLNDRLGIGGTPSMGDIHVLDSGGGSVLLQDTDTTDSWGLWEYNDADGLICSAQNGTTAANFRVKLGTSSSVGTKLMVYGSDGSVRFNEYGSGNITGTATKMLAVTAAGIVIEETLPTGGDITAVNAGTGLSGGGGSGDVTLDLDLGELTIGGTLVGTDYLIAENGGVDNRQLISSIPLSIFSNDQGWTSNVGDITGVTAGTNLTGGGTSGTVTLNMATGGIGAGTYGSTADDTKIDTITVDAYGRVTAVATGATGDILGVTAGTNLNGGGTSGTVTLNLDSSIDLTSVTTNELSYTYPTATGQFNGEIVTFGSFNGTIVAGDVIVYTTAGLNTGWFLAQANVTYSKGMLGIAMGTTPSAGILIKGFARHASFASGNLGDVLYLSPTTAGDTTNVIPSSTNNIVRIVGYMLNPTNDEIFFDPDKSWVQVS